MADETEAEPGALDEAPPWRRQVEGARFALAVLCGVRALIGGIGLLRAGAIDSIVEWWGFQGWVTAIALTVLYAVAAAGYREEARWPAAASVTADVLTILVVVDVFSRPVVPDGSLLSVMQLVVIPTVSLVLAMMAGRRRDPSVRRR